MNYQRKNEMINGRFTGYAALIDCRSHEEYTTCISCNASVHILAELDLH